MQSVVVPAREVGVQRLRERACDERDSGSLQSRAQRRGRGSMGVGMEDSRNRGTACSTYARLVKL